MDTKVTKVRAVPNVIPAKAGIPILNNISLVQRFRYLGRNDTAPRQLEGETLSYIKPYDVKLLENVLRVEDYDSPINWDEVFVKKQKLVVEVGCGNGHFLINSAKTENNCGFIGIDIKYKRLIRCREKQEKYSLTNLAWIWGEASKTISIIFKNNSINEIYMPFPDPWPKRKHHKNRLFKENFLDLIYIKLTSSGKFVFITDFKEYYDWSILITEKDQRFKIKNNFNNEALLGSVFAERWKKENRDFFAFELGKI